MVLQRGHKRTWRGSRRPVFQGPGAIHVFTPDETNRTKRGNELQLHSPVGVRAAQLIWQVVSSFTSGNTPTRTELESPEPHWTTDMESTSPRWKVLFSFQAWILHLYVTSDQTSLVSQLNAWVSRVMFTLRIGYTPHVPWKWLWASFQIVPNFTLLYTRGISWSHWFAIYWMFLSRLCAIPTHGSVYETLNHSCNRQTIILPVTG